MTVQGSLVDTVATVAPPIESPGDRVYRERAPQRRDMVVLRFAADLSIADVAMQLHRRRPGAIKAVQSRGLSRFAALPAGQG
jgi:hypothetical protein